MKSISSQFILSNQFSIKEKLPNIYLGKIAFNQVW